MSSKKPINVLERYTRFNIINNIINEKIKKDKNKCLYFLKLGVYTLNDVILLYKKIGSDSAYGTIFLSEIKDNNNKYKFATKVQLLTNDTYKELNFLELITKISIDNKNIHLPLMYNNLECNYFNKNDELLPLNLRDKDEKYKNIYSYYSTFVELANGDLGTFILKNYKKITFKELNNILSQCFISILSCHRIKFNHNDAHIYNFLYHIIKKDTKSCFKYVYNDLIFYIENLGLNWVIWDFGYSEKINLFDDYLKDYIDFIGSLIQLTIDHRLKLFTDYLYTIFDEIQKFHKDYDLIKYLLNILFFDKPIGNIITTIIL
jgi:hypothetical protein